MIIGGNPEYREDFPVCLYRMRGGFFMKRRVFVPICLLLVFLGVGIWYLGSGRKDEALKPLNKEGLTIEADASSISGPGTGRIEELESVIVPEHLVGEAGANESLQAVNSDLGASLIKTGEPNLGTARFIGGKTILISVFVNNARHKWDFEDASDMEAYSRLYYRLQTASEWIEAQAASYNVSSDIVWDWYNNEGLLYVTDTDSDLDGAMDSLYPKVASWISTHVDLEKLISKYGADNAIFMYYIKTDPNEEQPSFAFQFDFDFLTDQQVGYEGVWFNIGYNGNTLGASCLAHEILHCFGAVDLYFSNKQITDEYVNFLRSNGSEDIMYMIYDMPDTVSEQFSELDAYYVGLTSYSADAERFGLGQSAHLR